MKFTRLIISAVILYGSTLGAIKASVNDLPIRVVNGQSYHYYEVASKETVYSICHRLGVSKEELIKFNPAVADGLRAGTVLFFPVEENQAPAPAGTDMTQGVSIITHNVEKGQTIYGIAQQYGISTDALMEQNPIIRDGLKAGQTLHITVPAKGGAVSAVTTSASAASAKQAVTATADTGYVVKKKETFYSIANAHGISVAQLEAANPGIEVLREGQVLTIPGTGVAQTATVAEETTPVTVTTTELPENATTISVDDLAAASGVSELQQPSELSVAIVLPFMLEEETPSKSAQRYTEFYKGFLLAVDSLRNNGVPVRISVYDTEGSTDKVNEIIMNPELKNHGLIIAPDNAEQMAMLGEFGRVNGIKVLNGFIVRDETYRTNPAVMQGNIPSAMMLDKGVDAMIARMTYTVPVFITLADGTNDKTEFTDALKKRLDSNGVEYKTISVDGKLTPNDLKVLDTSGNYTFIPSTGRQSDVNRLLPGLIEWRDEAVMPSIKVIGYPEWITFRGETLGNMHNLNTHVYSRFFDDESNARTKQVDGKFKDWYGTGMENAVPRQGLLGFDTGMFVLNYLKNSDKKYDGVQNGFDFSVPEGASGDCNTLLYVINFRPGGFVDKTAL